MPTSASAADGEVLMCRGVRAFLRDRATPAVALVQAVSVDEKELRAALDEVFDQAVLFHGYADYMRDHDVYIYATADPRTGIAPQHLRYRFTHCVRAAASTAVRRDVWPHSLGDEFINYDEWLRSGEPDGYVWGVKLQGLYPGMKLMPESDETTGVGCPAGPALP